MLKVTFSRHPEVHPTGANFRYPGRGQRDTPVADAKGMLGPRSAHSSRRDCSRLPSDCPTTAQRQKVDIAYASRPPHAHAHKQTGDVANKQTHRKHTKNKTHLQIHELTNRVAWVAGDRLAGLERRLSQTKHLTPEVGSNWSKLWATSEWTGSCSASRRSELLPRDIPRPVGSGPESSHFN